MVVGAAKAGTSWVHQCLQEHPDVYVPDRKEIRFFSINYGKGKKWYKRFFKKCDNENAVGEVSPTYMIHRKAPKRIYLHNPKMKLIFILRNPVKRAYSHYCMKLRAGEVTKKIDNEIKKGSKIVKYGMYLDAIKRYLKFFEKENIKIHIFDDLKRNPKMFIKNVYKDVKVDTEFQPDIIDKKYHSRKNVPLYQWVHNLGTLVLRTLKKAGAARLVQKIRKSKIAEKYNRFNDGGSFPKMSKEKKIQLKRIYKDQIEGMQKYVDRDLKKEWL